MSYKNAFRCAALITLSLFLSACSLVPHQSTPQVDIAEHTQVSLPTPASLGYQFSASQLITASWAMDDKTTSEQLPVQLQVTNNEVALAGFSSWGTRVLSLSYDGEQIQTEVLNGLQGSLPQPEQVLFNLMITLWPSSAWEGSLNEVRWQMIDKKNYRAIFDSDGEKIIEIQYRSSNKLEGEIDFHHLKHPFSISIQTLQHHIN